MTSIGDALKAPPPVDPPASSEAAAPESPAPTVTEASAPAPSTNSETPAATAPQATPPAPAPTISIEELQKQNAGLMKAMIAERKKRQELEAGLQQQPQAPAPQYFEDPQRFIEQQVGAMKQQVGNQLVHISEAMAKQAHPDFHEKYGAFQEAVLQNPSLLDMVMADPNPGEAAYQTGKQILFNQRYGSEPEQIISKVREELVPTLRKELEAEILGKARQMVNQPTNILSARSAGGEEAPAFRYTTVQEALGRKKR